MTIAWILYVLLVGTLLACAALATDGILRRAALPARWVWLAALAGIVALAIAAPRRDVATRALQIPGEKVVTTAVLLPSTTSIGLVDAIAIARQAIESTVSSALGAVQLREPSAVELPLAIIWCLLSAAVLSVLVIVSHRVNRARRTWPLHEVHGTPVRIALATGPAVIGFSRPEIVVPSWLLERTIDEQRLVIVHEREHVAARDQLLLACGWLAAVLLPWHPAVWWSLSRMRLAIELDCDARVLDRGVQARPYGSLLIDIAGQCAGHRVGALALADRTSHLERRLLAMKNTHPRFTAVRTGALGAIALLAVLVACEARLPTSAEVEKMDVASAEKAAVEAKLLLDKKVAERIYTIDGVVVTAADAHALASSKIASVNIAKGSLAKTTDSGKVYTYVNIRTGDGATLAGGPMKVRFNKGQAETLEAQKGTLESKKSFNGLLFVDGVQVPSSSLARISPDDILTIDVLKGAAAAQTSSDPAAMNGIIKVTTKHAKQ
jgi:beta-lactamase regulating signal transducer with metallopeptidase domain